jgi:hypothetical protein
MGIVQALLGVCGAFYEKLTSLTSSSMSLLLCAGPLRTMAFQT